MKNKLHIFNSPKETAQAVAKIIAEKINQKNDFFYLAVSGGNTPKILFEILAEDYATKINWQKLKIFWVDERCVPPFDKESNYGMTYNSLLKKIPVPEENIFRMKGEDAPENEAKRYSETLEKELPKKNNLPQFDLILLGMGDDGHTASIFPNNLSLLNSKATVAVSAHPLSGQNRITLTGNILQNARQIIFLITGKSKSDSLSAILDNNMYSEKYPAYHLLSTTHSDVFADKDAYVL